MSAEENAENAANAARKIEEENKSKLEKLKDEQDRAAENWIEKGGTDSGEAYEAYKKAREEYESTRTEHIIRANAATLRNFSPEIVTDITKDLTQKVSDLVWVDNPTENRENNNVVILKYIDHFDPEGKGDKWPHERWELVKKKIGNIPRLNFENPYSADSIFRKDPKTGEPFKTWKDKLIPKFLKELIDPEMKSPFAQELAKKARGNPEYAEALKQMKQTQIDVFTVGVEKPILELTGKTKTEIQSDMEKIENDKNMNEAQQLSAKIEYGNKLLEENLEKIKERAGDKKATDWYKWIKLIGVLSAIGFGIWAACTVACDLAAAMDGCYAYSPQGEKMQTDIVPLKNSECSTGGNSSSGDECTKAINCCNTCGGCLKGREQTCAKSDCCSYERDRFGFPDNNISDDPTKSTRKDYVYKYECYTGLGAFNKASEDAMKNVLGLGGIGHILITAAIVIGCLIGGYFLIELILSFVRK